MKRLLFIADSLADGGAERVTSILANEICNFCETHILLFNEKENEYFLDERVVKHYYKSYSGITKFKYIEYCLGLKQLIKVINPEVIVSLAISKTNILVYLSQLFSKRKMVFSERNNPYVYPEQKIIRLIRDKMYSYIDHIVFQTKDAQEYFSGQIKKKSSIIPNPIKSNLPEKDYSIEANKTIVNFCRLDSQKNLPILFNAMAKVHSKFDDYKLDIYGQGPEKENLEHLIYELNASEYINIYPYTSDVYEIMKNSKLFVSSSDYEGISNSMLEALAIGLPCICTDCPIGGARLMINDGINGRLVNIGDVEMLANTIEELLENYELAIQLGENAKKLKEIYSEKNIVNKWLEVI